jgi:DNA mismatch endonuclease (patch repair protein)
MAAVRSRNTRPEVALRKALWRRGLRFRVGNKLPGHPDVVFPSTRLAIFVDGDFWHGNAWRIRGLPSFEAQFDRMNNGPFWMTKITENMGRDKRVNAQLATEGWCVFRVFESRIWEELAVVVAEIENVVRARRVNAGLSER